jgi:hypothetical protein
MRTRYSIFPFAPSANRSRTSLLTTGQTLSFRRLIEVLLDVVYHTTVKRYFYGAYPRKDLLLE